MLTVACSSYMYGLFSQLVQAVLTQPKLPFPYLKPRRPYDSIAPCYTVIMLENTQTTQTHIRSRVNPKKTTFSCISRVFSAIAELHKLDAGM